MLRKLSLISLCLVTGGVVAFSEPVRPLLTKENRFPELHRAELGFRFTYTETEDDANTMTSSNTNQYIYTPFVRYQAFEDLSLFARVPFVDLDPDNGDGESGLGDVSFGFELRAYEDIFDYPWIIPHAEVTLDTGDEDDGLGEGETVVTFGLAAGMTVEEVWHFVADARYEIHDDTDEVASIAFSVIVDLGDRFSMMGEVKLSNEDVGRDGDDHPALFLGGLSYDATEDLTFMGRGGAGSNLEQDVIVSLEANYSL